MKALLIGNDINNATSDYSWNNLLHDLIEYAQLKEPPAMDGKPFPMLYEEIFLNSAKQYGTKEKRIKTYIAVKALRLQPNEIHKEIMNMNVSTLLTTNYDLTLEASLKAQPEHIRNAAAIRENRYSLFRVNQVDDH